MTDSLRDIALRLRNALRAHDDNHTMGLPTHHGKSRFECEFEIMLAAIEEAVAEARRADWSAAATLSGRLGEAERQLAEARRQLDEHLAWKESAMTVLAEWDLVWEALGRPGPLGASKAANALAAIELEKQAREDAALLLWGKTTGRIEWGLASDGEHDAGWLYDNRENRHEPALWLGDGQLPVLTSQARYAIVALKRKTDGRDVAPGDRDGQTNAPPTRRSEA